MRYHLQMRQSVAAFFCLLLLLPATPSARADWAYGNTVIENADVTRAMADAAVLAHVRR